MLAKDDIIDINFKWHKEPAIPEVKRHFTGYIDISFSAINVLCRTGKKGVWNFCILHFGNSAFREYILECQKFIRARKNLNKTNQIARDDFFWNLWYSLEVCDSTNLITRSCNIPNTQTSESSPYCLRNCKTNFFAFIWNLSLLMNWLVYIQSLKISLNYPITSIGTISLPRLWKDMRLHNWIVKK